MSTANHPEKPVALGIGDAPPTFSNPDSELSVFVIFTSIHWQRRALEKAREIAQYIGARIIVVALQVVPLPLSLDEPTIPMEFLERRFEEKADDFPQGTQVISYLCRDPIEALHCILIPHCPVVMGVEKRWWPAREERLARKLNRSGFNITLVKDE
jgi:hypothetical protein